MSGSGSPKGHWAISRLSRSSSAGGCWIRSSGSSPKLPRSPSRNRKELAGVVPPWNQSRTVWELRVGDYRVFYDVDVERAVVIVQAVRRNGRRRTQEIL
jgi:hypothetical protein